MQAPSPRLTLKVETGNKIISELKPQLKRVFDGLSVNWDGRNHVGSLSVDAKTASEQIQNELDSYDQLQSVEYGYCDPEYVRWCKNQ